MSFRRHWHHTLAIISSWNVPTRSTDLEVIGEFTWSGLVVKAAKAIPATLDKKRLLWVVPVPASVCSPVRWRGNWIVAHGCCCKKLGCLLTLAYSAQWFSLRLWLWLCYRISMVPFRISASYNELYELGCRTYDNYSSTTTPLFEAPASAFSTRTSVAALYAQLAFAERQIFILGAENALLREKNEDLWIMLKVLVAEVATTEAVLRKDNNNTHLAKNRAPVLQRKLTDYPKFFRVLAEGDSHVINSTHVGVEKNCDAEVEATKDATHDSDSPWSKVLQTLINHHGSERFAADVDMSSNSCQIPHEKGKVVRFADSQATPKSNGATALVPPLPLSTSSCQDVDHNLKHCQDPLFNNLGDPLESEKLQVNSAFACPRSRASSIHTISVSYTKEGQLTLRPFSGQDYCSLRTPLRPSETNCLRRFTFHDSYKIEARAAEKRHGFLMPCIVSVLCALPRSIFFIQITEACSTETCL